MGQTGEKLAVSVATALLVSRRPVVLTRHSDVMKTSRFTKEYLTRSETNFTLLISALTDCHLLHFFVKIDADLTEKRQKV